MNTSTHNFSRRRALRAMVAMSLIPVVALMATPSRAHGGEASAASSLLLSMPVAVLSVAVEASATGTVWVLRRASDGATASLRFTGQALGASVVVAGTAVSVTVVAAGWLLSAAGEVLCLVPNALGESLLYNERIR